MKTATVKPSRSKVIKVRADSLTPHPLAQRNLVPAKINRLMQNLDLDAIGVLHVVEYEIKNKGKGLWIVDGQHRWDVLMKHGFGEWLVEVKIHLDVTDDARASDLFLKLNDRSPVSPFDKFKNGVIAGLPEAVGAQAVAKKYGLRIGPTGDDGQLACVSTLKKLWAVDEGGCLSRTLGVITASWGTRAEALEGKLIEGLGLVLSTFNGKIDDPVVVKKLAKRQGGPSGLIGDAKGLVALRKTTLARAVAECVIEAYNVGRRTGRLDPL